MRFLLWVLALLASTALSLCSTGPTPAHPEDKAGILGYQAKQGYVMCRIPVCCGGCKRPVPKVAAYRKPIHHGVNQLMFAGNLQFIAKE